MYMYQHWSIVMLYLLSVTLRVHVICVQSHAWLSSARAEHNYGKPKNSAKLLV